MSRPADLLPSSTPQRPERATRTTRRSRSPRHRKTGGLNPRHPRHRRRSDRGSQALAALRPQQKVIAAAVGLVALVALPVAAQVTEPPDAATDESAIFDRVAAEALADGVARTALAVHRTDQRQPDGGETRYVVEPGDSLADIAAAFGFASTDGWRRLFDANPDIKNPRNIEPGLVLRIPEAHEQLPRRELPRASRGGAGGGVWDRLARCESGGNWQANTGNGYYGGLQFSLSSWRAVGGTGYPHQHNPATQIEMAQRLQARQGWRAWPSCSKKLGLR